MTPGAKWMALHSEHCPVRLLDLARGTRIARRASSAPPPKHRTSLLPPERHSKQREGLCCARLARLLQRSGSAARRERQHDGRGAG
jgi:hypothetical protein